VNTTFDEEYLWYPSSDEWRELLFGNAPFEPGGYLRMYRGGMSTEKIMEMFESDPFEFTNRFNEQIQRNHNAEWEQRAMHNAYISKDAE